MLWQKFFIVKLLWLDCAGIKLQHFSKSSPAYFPTGLCFFWLTFVINHQTSNVCLQLQHFIQHSIRFVSTTFYKHISLATNSLLTFYLQLSNCLSVCFPAAVSFMLFMLSKAFRSFGRALAHNFIALLLTPSLLPSLWKCWW